MTYLKLFKVYLWNKPDQILWFNCLLLCDMLSDKINEATWTLLQGHIGLGLSLGWWEETCVVQWAGQLDPFVGKKIHSMRRYPLTLCNDDSTVRISPVEDHMADGDEYKLWVSNLAPQIFLLMEGESNSC